MRHFFYSNVFTARLRWLDAAMKFVCILIFLIRTACSYRSASSDSSLYCDSLLNKEYSAKSDGAKEDDECRLRRYKQRDVAQCLDRMAIHRSDLISKTNGISNHFVFLGDSRVRQQFYSFCRVNIFFTLC